MTRNRGKGEIMRQENGFLRICFVGVILLLSVVDAESQKNFPKEDNLFVKFHPYDVVNIRLNFYSLIENITNLITSFGLKNKKEN